MKKEFVSTTMSILSICLLVGCNPTSSSDTPNYDNNPKIPGGTTNTNPGLLAPLSLKAVPTTPNEIDLSWSIPNTYSTLAYQVLIFREQCAAGDTFCIAPFPDSAAAVSLYQIYSGTDSFFADKSVQTGVVYTYWMYISLNSSFSTYLSATSKTSAVAATFSSITSNNFWPNTKLITGLPHTTTTTLVPGANVLAAFKVGEGSQGGKIATAANGTIMYYADTANNRVVIMVRQFAYQCYIAGYADPLQLQACLYSNTGEPFVPLNVLGQPNVRTSLSCQDRQNLCASTAGNVSAVQSTDSSGAVTTQYKVTSSVSSSTVLGTYSNLNDASQAACTNQDFCSFGGSTLGRACLVKADSCMTGPTNVAVDGTNLLVADTGNNRVMIYNALPTQYAACDQSIGSDVAVNQNCAANAVVGKKSPNDLSDYSMPSFSQSPAVVASLLAGTNKLRISEFGAYGYNLSGISISSIQNGQVSTASSSPIGIPAIGTTKAPATFASGSLNATLKTNPDGVIYWGDLSPGGFVEYTVNVAQAGQYQIQLNYSSIYDDSKADLYLNGAVAQAATFNLTATGGGIYSLGDRILSKPGAMIVQGSDLFIADHDNNRIVRASSYNDPGAFHCTTTETPIAGGTSQGDWNPICRFSSVLGQQTLFQNRSFKQIVIDQAARGIDVIIGTGSGNSLTAGFSNYLKTYFGKPAALKVSDDGASLIVATDEQFLLQSADISTLSATNPRFAYWYLERIDMSPIALKSRLMIFPISEVSPSQPSCQPANFAIGGCDASGVIGQLNFQTIPIFSGSAADDYRNSISYGLTSVTDFVISGSSMLAVDSVTNDVYVWTDWTKNVQGRPFTYRISNPAGAAFPQYPARRMPNLSSISGIVYDALIGQFVISDPGNGLLYQVTRP